ncbi:nitroreductase family deazaflavin-dependent oxidoreductase [Streptomyces sp. NPDC048603]|uniref:nitroreductase family deazaflavin-dependent oxidoreductase n=1 Tax=Streptomyces sp. NPDC048603 TaxID=3365577 RepID=UPI003718A66A
MTANSPYYVQGNGFDQRLHRFIGRLARLGVSLAGTAELSVRGRTSGAMQRIPVNPYTHGDTQYLVSARGHSQWVRNMRAAGAGELRVGRKVRAFTAVEITDPAEQVTVLRGYLEKWGWEVGRFFQGVTAASSDAVLRAAAADHPVFRITVAR